MKHCFEKRLNEILKCPCGEEDLQWVKPKIVILFCTEIFSLSKISTKYSNNANSHFICFIFI